jgi:thiazolylpeptide-type bacteriocin precursor
MDYEPTLASLAKELYDLESDTFEIHDYIEANDLRSSPTCSATTSCSACSCAEACV